MGITESKKTRAGICPDGKHYCQNSDLQRGVPAVRGFTSTRVSLTDLHHRKLRLNAVHLA